MTYIGSQQQLTAMAQPLASRMMSWVIGNRKSSQARVLWLPPQYRLKMRRVAAATAA